MTDTKAIVIVRFDEYGEQTYHVIGGEAVRLFIVDERCPNDRVYEWLPRDPADEIKAILKDDPIGSSQDERHPAIAAKVLAFVDGKPHLSVVE
jgi:hypothetical protein